jgi:hypothetical protein
MEGWPYSSRYAASCEFDGHNGCGTLAECEDSAPKDVSESMFRDVLDAIGPKNP